MDIQDYFDDAHQNKAPPNKAGLSLWLGVHKDTLNEYAQGKYDTPDQEYSVAIKRAYGQIEQHWIGLLARPAPNVGAIFYMKNALGYRDVVENPGGGTTINFTLPPEIAAKHQLPTQPTPVPHTDVKPSDNQQPAPADAPPEEHGTTRETEASSG